MSNRAYIQQETTIRHKTNKIMKTVVVFDDYNQGSILLDEYQDSFFEDDLELLEFTLVAIKSGGLEAVDDVLSSVFEDEKGMIIEDSWYQWEQIKPVFEKIWG